MTFFVDGLSPTTRTIVARFRENEPRYELSFERLVQFVQDQGDAYRAQRVTMKPMTSIRKTVNKKRSVHFAGEEEFPTEEEDTEYIQAVPEDSVDTDELPSTTTGEEEEQEHNLFSPIMVRPGTIAYGGRSSTPNRVGWTSNTRNDRDRLRLIYHKCYGYDHISPKCPLQPIDLEQIVKNHNGLKPEEKNRVPETAYRMASSLAVRLKTNGNDTGTKKEEQRNEDTQGKGPGGL